MDFGRNGGLDFGGNTGLGLGETQVPGVAFAGTILRNWSHGAGAPSSCRQLRYHSNGIYISR